jgi:hypothetical protein
MPRIGTPALLGGEVVDRDGQSGAHALQAWPVALGVLHLVHMGREGIAAGDGERVVALQGDAAVGGRGDHPGGQPRQFVEQSFHMGGGRHQVGQLGKGINKGRCGGRPAKGGVQGSVARSGRATVTAAATPRRQETGNGSALIGAREEPSAPFTLRSPTSVGPPREGVSRRTPVRSRGLPPGQGDRSPRRCVRRFSGRCGPASHRRRRSRSGSPAPLLCLDGGLEPPPGWLLNPRAARGPALAAPPVCRRPASRKVRCPELFRSGPGRRGHTPRRPATDPEEFRAFPVRCLRSAPDLTASIHLARRYCPIDASGHDLRDGRGAPPAGCPQRSGAAAVRWVAVGRASGRRPGPAQRRGGADTELLGRGKRSDLAEAPTGQGPAPVETR